MAALIPRSEIRKLCAIFEIDNFESFLFGQSKKVEDPQTNLFGEVE
jgi:hypothetical protein